MPKKEKDLRVYKLDKDAIQVLHNIVSDLNHDKQLKNKWDLPFKEEYWCNIKTHGDQLELRTECLKGGFRTTDRASVQELRNFAEETKRIFAKFESAVRREFKTRAGKALKWGKGHERCDYEPVALNGLYKFYYVKCGPIKVELGGQEFAEGTDLPNEGKLDTDTAHQLIDVSKMSKRKWG